MVLLAPMVGLLDKLEYDRILLSSSHGRAGHFFPGPGPGQAFFPLFLFKRALIRLQFCQFKSSRARAGPK